MGEASYRRSSRVGTLLREELSEIIRQEVRDPRRWLYRTVHNLSINQLRKHRRMRSLTSMQADTSTDKPLDLTDPQPLPDEQIAREEGIGQVRLGLAALDERSRGLLRMKFEENLSYKDMSERTGLKVGHVGYLLHHAIKALGVELEKTGVIR